MRALDVARVNNYGVGIMDAIADGAPALDIPFVSVADAFRIIEDVQIPIIILQTVSPVAGVEESVLDKLRHGGGLAEVCRWFQRHVRRQHQCDSLKFLQS